MISIQEIEHAPLIELSKPKELSHGMKIHRVGSEGPFSFKISAKIPFAPSVFQGTGEEERQGIVLSISEEDHNKFTMFSESFKTQLAEKYPDIAGKWSSSSKQSSDKYPAQLRAKIYVKGERKCKYYDMEGSTANVPESWRGLEVTAVVRLSSIYVQPRGAGVILTVTHIKYDPNAQQESNPFA